MRAALLIALAAAGALRAEVSGVVINRTTGKPQANATVTLLNVGGSGMQAVRSVRSAADGTFTIPDPAAGAHLLQTLFDGVTYSHMLPPGQPTTGLTLEVFSASSNPGAAKVTNHMILVEPGPDGAAVNESVMFRNEGKTTFHDPARGALRFFLPPEAEGKVRVMATAPQGMPVERPAEKTAAANVYKVDFAIKPGETRIDMSYRLPAATPLKFASKSFLDAPVRMVVPPGVTVKGDSIELLGQEPQSQASVYGIKRQEFAVEIEGAGALAQGQGEEEQDEGQGLRQIRPRVYDRFPVVLGLGMLILALGFVLLYRKQPPPGQRKA